MTLLTDLHDALGPVIGDLAIELGEQALLRRRGIAASGSRRAADGSRVSTLVNVPGVSSPFRILPIARSATVRAHDWGQDVTVDLEAYVLDTEPMAALDLIKVTTGEYAGKWFEAGLNRPEPAGAVKLWAFKLAGNLDDQDVGT